MKLVIEIQDGKPINHPIDVSNLILAFPNFDVNNLPEKYIPFERIEKPHIGVYEVLESHEYILDSGICKDSWNVRPMTQEEKDAKIQLEMQVDHPSNYVFDENACYWVPPVPYPTDGKQYFWNQEQNLWQELPNGVAR